MKDKSKAQLARELDHLRQLYAHRNIDEPQQKVSPGGAETILVIDDEDGVRRAVGLLLEQLGYTAVPPGGEPEVLRIVEDIRLKPTGLKPPQIHSQ